MQSSVVGPQHVWRSYTNLHRQLPHPSTSIRTQTFLTESTSVKSRHRQTKLSVVSSSVASTALLNWTVTYRHIHALNLIASALSVVSSSVASTALLNWTVTYRHIHALNLIASATVLFTAWLFFYAIPSLQDLRKACDSLVIELDVAREQLPNAMADARLSGAEISDLTMELSDLGQEITNKVRSTTHVARVAEEKFRQFASMTATGNEVREQTVDHNNYPPLAKSARGMKEGIIKTRSSLQMLISSIYYIKLFRKFFAAKA